MAVKTHGSLYEVSSANGEEYSIPHHSISYLRSKKNDSMQDLILSNNQVVKVYNNDFDEIKSSLISYGVKMEEVFAPEKESLIESIEPRRRGRPAKLS